MLGLPNAAKTAAAPLFTQDQGSTHSSSLPAAIETSTQPSSYLSLIPQPAVTQYSPDGGHFYTPAPPIFPGLEVRPRLGSNSTAGQVMAHAHRSTTLPHPGTHLSAREAYAPATPTFRRSEHHIQRSPPFSGIRRSNPLSPTHTSTSSYGSLKMDTAYPGSRTQPSIPPLGPLTSLGHLSYADTPGTPIQVDISGIIDKGFFVAENEWTCYRRNYFACVCSFSLTPLFPNSPIQFLPTGSTQAYNVYGFAMCISAVVSDNESHTIDLVQHTPKRDKGPIAKPDKVRLSPKPPQASQHPLTGLYGGGPEGSLGSPRYEQGFGQAQQSSAPTEHTFERIQFKQATANNGKRRAAQQYYHLLVELWADIGQQGGVDPWVKVAYKKSAKMIVRGRSPGHYQSERRGSASSGPGGSSGSMGGGGYPTGLLGPGEYPTHQTTMLGGGGGYAQQYETRSGGYGGTRPAQGLIDSLGLPDDVKAAMASTKDYQYYPATIYEGEHDPRQQQQQQQQQQHHQQQEQPQQQHHHHHHHHQQQQQQQQQQQHHHHQPQVEMFSHARQDGSGSGTAPSMSAMFDPTKVKPEMENGLPSLLYSSGPYYERCGRFDRKTTTSGQYPTLIPPPSTTMNMT
ncbi:hypothetical protein VTH82DRAFT_2043 [Thermothelomyces myriococcoides]